MVMSKNKKTRKWKVKKWWLGLTRNSKSRGDNNLKAAAAAAAVPDDISRGEDGTLSASDEGSMKQLTKSSVSSCESTPVSQRRAAAISADDEKAAMTPHPHDEPPASPSSEAPSASSPVAASPASSSAVVEKARKLIENKNVSLTTEFPHLPIELGEIMAAKKLAQSKQALAGEQQPSCRGGSSSPSPSSSSSRKTNIVVVSTTDSDADLSKVKQQQPPAAATRATKNNNNNNNTNEHDSGPGTLKAALQQRLERARANTTILPTSLFESLFACGQPFGHDDDDDNSTLGLETAISHRMDDMDNVFHCFRPEDENDYTIVGYDGEEMDESFASLASFTLEEGTLEGTVEEGEDDEQSNDNDEAEEEEETSHTSEPESQPSKERHHPDVAAYITRKILNPHAPPSTIAVRHKNKKSASVSDESASTCSDPARKQRSAVDAPSSSASSSSSKNRQVLQQPVDARSAASAPSAALTTTSSSGRRSSSSSAARRPKGNNVAMENSKIEVEVIRRSSSSDDVQLTRDALSESGGIETGVKDCATTTTPRST